MRFVVSESALYYTDNGAILCGRHLGTSARLTGRDISGQRIVPVTDADRAEWAKLGGGVMACETCEASEPTTDLCPICKTPAHASESDDQGRHERCLFPAV